MGYPATDDLSGPVQEGVGWADLGDLRRGTGQPGYLRDGASAEATTPGEVILTAGAIGSPQLLPGTVRLATADPEVAPRVDPGFLTDSQDTDRLETGLRMIREAVAGAGLSPLRAAEVWPGPAVATPSRAARLHPPRRKQLLPSGRYLPDRPWTTGRWWTRTCGCTAWRGSGSPTRPSCRSSRMPR